MTAQELRDTLARLGLSQRDFGRVVECLSGTAPHERTLRRWFSVQAPEPNYLVAALLALLDAHPVIVRDLKRQIQERRL